jgi:2-polyprenyl-6-methoxyphenol hydroxylase-like FAD-dependent oxidoreductase
MTMANGQGDGQGHGQGSAIIVGGSLCGLSIGIALARLGIKVTVLERSLDLRGGAGLGVDMDMLPRVVGVDPHGSLPTIRGRRYSTNWPLLRNWLLAIARTHANLALHDGVAAQSVSQDAERAYVTTTAGRLAADIVVGADGYRSLVRGYIDPENPDAEYAGYMLWRGLVPETKLPEGASAAHDFVDHYYIGPYRLVGYLVPGLDGSVAKGSRLISWAWYDRTRLALLERFGCVENNRVRQTLPAEHFPPDVKQELETIAATVWPERWREAILATLARDYPFATPVAEYRPRRLVRGRVAILGDAAHVASPVTGIGYKTGLYDAEALFRHAQDGVAGEHAIAALDRYEDERLSAGQSLVEVSRQWGKDFLAGVATADPPKG